MKKIATILLAMAMVLSLFACGTNQTAKSAQTDEKQEDDGIVYCPWKLDASAKAKQEQKIHYYFMASYGLFMSAEANHPEKWGDACLIALPDGKTMLIDGGMEVYGPVLVENLKRLGVEKLDYVIMSHSHEDHCFGILLEGGIFDNFEVGQVYWSGIACSYWEDIDVEAICQEHGYPLQALQQGQVHQFGEVTMEVLWPDKSLVGTAMDDTDLNNNSLVLRFDYKDHSSLFTGDLYQEAEAQIVEVAGEKLDVDLLKAPHHGSPTSSSLAFLQAVKPEMAVATGYQDVTVDMEERYDGVGADLYFDRYNGYVHVESDGTDLTVDTHQTRK